MMLKLLVLSVLVLVCQAVNLRSNVLNALSSKVESAGRKKVFIDDLATLEWKVLDGDKVEWTLSYQTGQGWLGLGYSPLAGMVGSKVVVGTPTDGIKSYSLEKRAPSGVLADTEAVTFSDASFTEKDGVQSLKFVAPTSAIPLTGPIVVAKGNRNELGYHGKGPRYYQIIKDLDALEDAPAPKPIEDVEKIGSGVVLQGKGKLSWSRIGDTMFWTYTYPATSGWLGVGTSPQSQMVGSTAVVGQQSGVGVYALNGKSGSQVVPSDAFQVTDASFVSENGLLVLTFVTPLTAIPKDKPVVVAYGPQESLAFHGPKGEFAQVIPLLADLPPVQAPEVPPPVGEEPQEGDGIEDSPARTVSVLNGAGQITYSVISGTAFISVKFPEGNGNWIGIGIGSQGATPMIGANVVVGDAAGGVRALNLGGRSPASFTPSNAFTVSDGVFKAENGASFLSFSMPASELEDLEGPFIVASGPISNGEIQYHGANRQVISDIEELPEVTQEVEAPPTPDEPAPEPDSEGPIAGSVLVLGGAGELTYRAIGDSLFVSLSLPGRGGNWVGIGLGSDGATPMIGADVVVGDSAGGVRTLNLGGRSPVAFTPTNAFTIADASYSSENGDASLTFAVPLTDFDLSSRIIVASGPVINGGIQYHGQDREVVQFP